MNVDLDKVIKEVDLKSLETLLQNITFASLDKDDFERLGDSHFLRLFKLTQFSIEYLLYTQNYLESLCKGLDLEYKATFEKADKYEEMVRKYQHEVKMLRKELKLKQKTLGTYEYLMKLPPDQEQDVIKCHHCTKFFLSRDYLQKHYSRHHPEIDFYREFDTHTMSLNEREQQQQVLEQKEVGQEQLFEKIKAEMFQSLQTNFGQIEQEIGQLRERQDY